MDETKQDLKDSAMEESNEQAIQKYPYHRKYVRHKVRMKVDVEEAKNSYHTWTHNVSKDGVCFEIPDQLDPGREVTLWIYLEKSSSNPVQSRCKVVWHDKSPSGTRHGAQFLFFASDGKKRLSEWLDSF